MSVKKQIFVLIDTVLERIFCDLRVATGIKLIGRLHFLENEIVTLTCEDITVFFFKQGADLVEFQTAGELFHSILRV